MKWILFVYRECNFCPRAGLIPAAGFLAVHPAEWELIQRSTEIYQNIPVLWQEIVWQDRCGTHILKDWHKIVDLMQQAIEWGDEVVNDPQDQFWIEKIRTFHIESFDPIKTYQRLYEEFKDNLIGGFVKLERDQGSPYKEPLFEDTHALMAFYENMAKKDDQ